MVRKIFAIILIIGLLGALIPAAEDFLIQENNKEVAAVLDFTAVKTWAAKTNSDPKDLLQVALDSGIRHIGLSELSFAKEGSNLTGFFETELDVAALTASDLAHAMRVGEAWTKHLKPSDIGAEDYYLVSQNTDRLAEIARAAREKYGSERIQRLDGNDMTILRIIADASRQVVGLGFDPAEVKMLQQMGFSLVMRPINVQITEEQVTEYFLNTVARLQSDFFIPQPAAGIEPKLIIFAGNNGVLGEPVFDSPDLKATVAKYFGGVEALASYGYVEMSVIPGDKEMAKLTDYRIARVHSVPGEEWDKRYDMSKRQDEVLGDLIERYVLAVRDRSVNILYLRPFTRSAEFNKEFFSALRSALERHGIVYGSFKIAEYRKALSPGIFLLLLVALAAAGGLLFLEIFPRREIVAAVLAALGFGALAGLGVAISSDLAVKLAALLSAIFFPALAAAYLLRASRKDADEKILPAIRKVIVATAMALAGGLVVHGFLADASYLSGVAAFSGVKIALVLPVALVFLLLILQKDFIKDVMCFLRQNVKVYHLVMAGIFVALAGLVLMRSGNNPIIPVSSLERKLRILLQSRLPARPRFKEFILGYPLLLLGLLYSRQRLSSILILIGTIGLASVVNTFSHLHKPLSMALNTTIVGLIAGLLLGLGLYALLQLGIRVLRRLKIE